MAHGPSHLPPQAARQGKCPARAGTWSHPAALGALCLCFLACAPQDQVAGGFDDVENPAIRASLVDSAGNAYGDGVIRLYARYQNPLADSLPLIERDVPAGTAALITDSSLTAAMEAARLRGTPWPDADTVGFNLSVAAPAGEAFLADFLMVRGTGTAYRFLRVQGASVVRADGRGVLEVAPVMAAPVLDQAGDIGDRGRQLDLRSVFVPGSPYATRVADDGSFRLARMARGVYEVKAVSGDGKIYSAADSLTAGTAYFPSDWSEADLIWVEEPGLP